MKIRNISLRVVSLLVLTFVFVVATAVFTVFDIRTQTENMETSLAEEARTFAREMDAVWEFMDNSPVHHQQYHDRRLRVQRAALRHRRQERRCHLLGGQQLLHPLHELRAAPGPGQARCLRS